MRLETNRGHRPSRHGQGSRRKRSNGTETETTGNEMVSCRRHENDRVYYHIFADLAVLHVTHLALDWAIRLTASATRQGRQPPGVELSPKTGDRDKACAGAVHRQTRGVSEAPVSGQRPMVSRPRPASVSLRSGELSMDRERREMTVRHIAGPKTTSGYFAAEGGEGVDRLGGRGVGRYQCGPHQTSSMGLPPFESSWHSTL